MLIDDLYKKCYDGECAVLYCDDDMNIYLYKKKNNYEIAIDNGSYVEVVIKLPKRTDYETALLHIIKALIDKCNMFRHKANDYEWKLNDIINGATSMIKAHKEEI